MAAAIKQIKGLGSQASDAVVTRLAAEDTVPWYKKPNLRGLYILMLPTLIGMFILTVSSVYDANRFGRR
jgi:hypothetical protein